MAYTVRKLLESEQFPKMKLLCGEKGLDLEVKGIRIIEIEDMERYLTGGGNTHNQFSGIFIM